MSNAENIKSIPISNIFFMARTISSYFNSGILIDEQKPDEIKRINVFLDEDNNKYWTTNNRSLYVLKKHNVQNIECIVKLKKESLTEFKENFSSNTSGLSIEILANEGRWEKEYYALKRTKPNFSMTLKEFIDNKLSMKNHPSKDKKRIEKNLKSNLNQESINTKSIEKDTAETVSKTNNSDIKPYSLLSLLIAANPVLPVSQIYFLQEYISSYFHDSTHIDKKDPLSIKSIDIYYDKEENKYLSKNNRSLYVLKKHNIPEIRVKVLFKNSNLAEFEKR